MRAVVGGGGEAFFAGQSDLSVGNADDVGAAFIEGGDFARVDVEAGHAEALFAEEQGEGEADVAHSDDADAGLARLNALEKFSGLVNRGHRHGITCICWLRRWMETFVGGRMLLRFCTTPKNPAPLLAS